VHAAARDALVRGAPAAAGELVELARRLGEVDSETQRRRTVDLADYLLTAGDRVRAREVLQGIDSWSGWSPRLQARAIARLCQLVCDTEHPASAIEFLERMLREPFGAEARAAVHGALSYSTSEVDAARAEKHADEALALLESLGEDTDPWIHATALYMRLRARVLLGQGVDRGVIDRIRGIEALLPPERRPFDRASPSIAYWLNHVDDLDASRTWLERNLREAAESGYESVELHALAHLAITECWAGNFELARHHALAASRLARELKASFAALLADEALALVHAHLGDADAVRAIVERRPTAIPQAARDGSVSGRSRPRRPFTRQQRGRGRPSARGAECGRTDRLPRAWEVWAKKASGSDPLMTCRKLMGGIETGPGVRVRDEPGGCLLIGQVVSGVEVARAWSGLRCGTWEPVVPRPRAASGAALACGRAWKGAPQAAETVRGGVPMWGRGADRLVVAVRPGNAGGAKGAGDPGLLVGQPRGRCRGRSR
jgi:hypothetical protein